MNKIVARFGKVPGQVELETEGFKGPACKEALDRTVGNFGKNVSEKTTDDYYENPDAGQQGQASTNG